MTEDYTYVHSIAGPVIFDALFNVLYKTYSKTIYGSILRFVRLSLS